MAKLKTMIVAGGVAVLLLGGLGAGLRVYLTRDTPSSAADHTTDNELAIAGAKMAVENRFPEAQLDFGQSYVRWNKQTPSVCGRVDIVQQQDSFDGEGRYVSSPGQLLVEEADGSDVLDQTWSDVCA